MNNSKLLIGMDVSGNPSTGDCSYLGLVMGTIESITSLSKQLPEKIEHLALIRNSCQKEKIRNLLQFDGKNRVAFCFKLHKSEVLSEIKKYTRHKKTNDKKLYDIFEKTVAGHIKKYVEPFSFVHKLSVTELDIQCDGDCNQFVKKGGWKIKKKGSAYKIADCVAWFNNAQQPIVSCKEINLIDKIKENMLKSLKI